MFWVLSSLLMYTLQISFPSLWLVLAVLLDKQKFLILMEFNLMFYFMGNVLGHVGDSISKFMKMLDNILF